MTDRIPLDHLTSDQYDQLCDERDRLRAQLADMTSGRDRWKWYRDDAERRVRIQRERAEQAETRLQHLQATSEAAGSLLTRTTDERDQLRTAVEAVRQLHHPVGVVAAAEFGEAPDCAVCGPNRWPCPTYDAVTDLEPTPSKEQLGA